MNPERPMFLFIQYSLRRVPAAFAESDVERDIRMTAALNGRATGGR
jgi:hypothetical protein